MSRWITAGLALVAPMACGEEYDVVLLRPTRYLAEKPKMAGDAHRYLQSGRRVLDAAGLRRHTITEEQALEQGFPEGEFLLCAYNPNMAPDMAAAIGGFLDAGGHAMFCYYLEASLRERFGMGELVYTPEGEAKLFRQLRATAKAPPGMPALVRQDSWNAYLPETVGARMQVIGNWLAADGQTSGGPGLLKSDEAVWMGHIFTAGDVGAKAQMMLALIGSYDPQMARGAAGRALDAACDFRRAGGAEKLVELARGTKTESDATQLAEDIRQARGKLDQSAPAEAFTGVAELRERATAVYLESLPSRQDAMRGAWVVSPRGVGDWGWDKTVRVAAENGLTALFVRIAWRGQAHYQSKVLPMAVEPGDDPLREAVEACHKHGLKIHAWFINLNWRTPPQALIDEWTEAGRWQLAPDGEAGIFEAGDRVYWVNPSDPRNVAHQAEMMAEVAANYAVDGVHFDYIRYENYNGSYGEADRQRFEEWMREPIANWPDDVLVGTRDRPAGPLHGFFCRWRTDQVSNVVRACAEAVRKASPDCKLSAAVYPSFPYHRKSVAQDWARWLRNGWLDFVCPMTYDSPSYYDRHVDRVGRQRPAAEGPLMVGIGAWLHGDATTVADQIVADRELGADGFLLFSYTPWLGTEVLPRLRSGVFAEG